MKTTLLIVCAAVLSRTFALVPVITPAEGTYVDSVEVAITCPGADSMFYTTDRSDPTAGSLRYTGPFKLYASSFVNALAFAAGAAGEIATSLFEITITDPITVLSPNGGEVCAVDQTIPIRWTAKAAAVTSAAISVSVDDGRTWLAIVDLGIVFSSPQWGDYQWRIPATLQNAAGAAVSLQTTTALIKVHDYSHPGINGVSDAVFIINASSRVQRSTMTRREVTSEGRLNVFRCNGARRVNRSAGIGVGGTKTRGQLCSSDRSAAGINVARRE